MPGITDTNDTPTPGAVVEMVDARLFTSTGGGHTTRPTGWLCHYAGTGPAGHLVTSRINGRVYFAGVRATAFRVVDDPEQVCGCVPPHLVGEFPSLTPGAPPVRSYSAVRSTVGPYDLGWPLREQPLIDCGGCLAEHYQLPPGVPHTCQQPPPASPAEAARRAGRAHQPGSSPVADQLVRRLMTFGRGRCNWLLVDVWATEHRAPTADDLCPQPATRRVEVVLPGEAIGGGEFATRTILTSLCHGHAVSVSVTLAGPGGGTGEHREIVEQPAAPAAGWHPVHSETKPRTVLYWRRQARPHVYLIVVEDADRPGRWLWSQMAGSSIVAQGHGPSQYEAMQAADRHYTHQG